MANSVYNQYLSTQPDGSTLQNDLTGRLGEKLVAQAQPQYANMVDRGMVFTGSTAAAGTAFPATNSTSPTFGLWNKSSAFKAVILQFAAGYTSGTIALGTMAYTYANVGYATGTGAPISAFNAGTAVNNKLGATNTSQMSFTPAGTNTLAGAGSILKYTGNSIESATAGTGVFSVQDFVDGKIIVPPGYFLYITGTVAQTALFSMSLTWAEVPL